MPRRKPESVKEVRYEFSLGPKEQPLIDELTEFAKSTNQVVSIGKVAVPLAITAGAVSIFYAGKYLAAGIANIGAGLTPDAVLRSTFDSTLIGKVVNKAKEPFEGLPLGPDWGINLWNALWE